MTGDAGDEQQDDDSETIERVMDTRIGKKGGDELLLTFLKTVLLFFLIKIHFATCIQCFKNIIVWLLASSHWGFHYWVCCGRKWGPV